MHIIFFSFGLSLPSDKQECVCVCIYLLTHISQRLFNLHKLAQASKQRPSPKHNSKEATELQGGRRRKVRSASQHVHHS